MLLVSLTLAIVILGFDSALQSFSLCKDRVFEGHGLK